MYERKTSWRTARQIGMRLLLVSCSSCEGKVRLPCASGDPQADAACQSATASRSDESNDSVSGVESSFSTDGRLPVEDWQAVFSNGQRVWTVSAGGTVLSWSTDDWPLYERSISIEHLPGETLTDVWASSSQNVWVTSESGAVFQWDGGGWQAYYVTDPAHAPALSSIWVSSAHDIWAVGEDQRLLHFDGQSWTKLDVSQWAWSGYGKTTQVLGTSASDVLVAGCNCLHHFDGSSWSDLGTHHDEGDYHHDDCWEELFLDPSSTLWVTGYRSTDGWRSGKMSPLTAGYRDGQLLRTVDARSSTAWSGSDGALVFAECAANDCEVSQLSPEGLWVPFERVSFPLNDLWGDQRWIWGVGLNGIIVRLETPGS